MNGKKFLQAADRTFEIGKLDD